MISSTAALREGQALSAGSKSLASVGSCAVAEIAREPIAKVDKTANEPTRRLNIRVSLLLDCLEVGGLVYGPPATWQYKTACGKLSHLDRAAGER